MDYVQRAIARAESVCAALSRRGIAPGPDLETARALVRPLGVGLASTWSMGSDAREKHDAYRRLFFMAVGSFVAMYVLMYMMVDVFADVFLNINQLYMAAMMTAPMVVLELLLMQAMFPSRRANVVIVAGAALTLIVSIALLRRQAGVSDEELLRSMIPHHSGAILMCERASLRDAQIEELCRGIISSQEAEIGWMKQKLDQL